LITSVTPTNTAVDVPTNSSIVFVFDQDMLTSVSPIGSKPGSWVGNFAITPTNLSVSGKWSADKRTLTLKCTPGWPYLTNVTWTLNPPTNGANLVFPQFAGTNHQLLATVSGIFTTAAPPPPPPKIISISPTNRAVEVPPLSPLVFTFDEDMDTSVQVVATGSSTANCGVSPSGTFSNAVWSADKRTLTFTPLGQLPLGIVVSWDLNPASAGSSLKNLYGEPLAYTLGSFTVLTNTGGNPFEICQTTTNTSLGTYSIAETLQTNIQVSANAVVPLSNSFASFFAFGKSPGGDKTTPPPYTFTNGSLTLPGGTLLMFTNQIAVARFGVVGVHYTNSADSALLADFPPGTYVMRLDLDTSLESTISMSVSDVPPAPMLTNYDAAQAIDPGHDFTLQWNALPATAPGPFIQLSIQDTYGKLIFAAPNQCVSRTLDPSATSVVIPANTFRPGVLYQGVLEFGYNFYYDTNALPSTVGDGYVLRATSFQLQTSFAPNTFVITPPGFTGIAVSGGLPTLTLHGMPGKSYTIQRADTLAPANWSLFGSVTTDSSGNATFSPRTVISSPAFFRALAN
jgi:hypothetical protein